MLAAQGPASGYDLRARIDGSIGHFWQEGYGQLYPVLGQLADEGLVIREEDTPGAVRGRAEYRITPAGRATLAEWLRQPPVRHVERNELLIKVFFALLGDPDDCVRFITDSREEAQSRLHELDAVTESIAGLADQPDHALWMLTIDYGVRGLRAHLDWCDHALDTLRKAT